MQRLRQSAPTTLALLLALAAPALADDARKAAVHLKQGAAYYKAEQYDAAIAEFKKSYALDNKPQTLFNIANAYFKKADYQSAIDFFQQYLDVDPDGRFAPQALEFSAIAKKALSDEEARRAAADAAAKVEAERARVAAAQEQKRVAVTARVRNAEAFAQAGAWLRAGDEYRAASEISADPAYLLQAADAYRRQPALAQARDAYRDFLDKVPLGAEADTARTRRADVTRELDRQAELERARVAAGPAAQASVTATAPAPRGPSKVFLGGALVFPARGLNGKTELRPAGVTGDAQLAVESGAGFELSGSYALGGVHALTASVTYLKFTLDDGGASYDDGGATRVGLGYRLLTRAGATFRPTLGLHASYYMIEVADPDLAVQEESRPGLEPEVGLIIQARAGVFAHLLVRLDVVPILGTGVFLGGLGAGLGAHF